MTGSIYSITYRGATGAELNRAGNAVGIHCFPESIIVDGEQSRGTRVVATRRQQAQQSQDSVGTPQTIPLFAGGEVLGSPPANGASSGR